MRKIENRELKIEKYKLHVMHFFSYLFHKFSSFTSQFSTPSGFTLLELLVSLFMISTIGSLVLGIVWFSLRSTIKVNNMQSIRQNGNFAIAQMTKMLQFAQQFEGVSTDGVTYSAACQAPGTTPQQTYSYVKVLSNYSTDIILSCSSSPSTIASNSASLIDNNIYSVSSCNFTCTQATADSPYTIGIQFTIAKKITGNLFDEPAPVNFQTSATIRNLYQ